MGNNNIIEKLKRLGALEPGEEYRDASKKLVMMRRNASFELPVENSIVGRLRALREIEPDPNYALMSRISIIKSIELSKQSFWRIFELRNIFRNSLNYTLAVGMATVLLAVMVTGASKFVKPVPIVAELDNSVLLSEANSLIKDIDIHLEEIELYKTAAEKTAMALDEASANGPKHINNLLIEREAENINYSDPTNSKIDELLNKAIF